MDIRSTLATQLYSQVQTVAKPAPESTGTAGAAFATATRDFMETLRSSEATVQSGLVGRADPQAVVEALAATEMAVQTAVAVRDKVVEAYQEILRMPV
ncbi:flagellar hook-basal body complex protein FliE [Amaricoccus sp.]|uniref:flagellar hook-basal body complex protein FliE n=1 Tax=Amaricoccus sp. TaxID=1872485 RepID=UPI002628D204|nr:flagellar hook-basal body complex protein FliE [uncultured Amaricoccus sp.]